MTTRRGILGSVASASQPAADPILVLYQNFLERREEDKAITERFDTLWTALTAKHGHPQNGQADPYQEWRRDPRWSEFDELGGVVDEVGDRRYDAGNAVLNCHASTLAGFRAKIAVVLMNVEIDADSHSDEALPVLREVALWLGGSAEPVKGAAQ